MSAVLIPRSRFPVLELQRDASGKSTGAQAWLRTTASAAQCQKALDDISEVANFKRFSQHIPMIRDIRRDGPHLVIELQFKVSLLSVKFGAKTHIVRESERAVRFDYVSGEPKGLSLRFAYSNPEALPGETLLEVSSSFDPDSLGWLAKHFLKSHPEIRDGVQTGSAVATAEALRQSIETA
jgi:hypothetical protein